ncbi:aspartate kinase [Aureitalea marina]|uniref:homoserine dehydrogenase n=1 Tax=Aureitalea marina TaxID=930804 RepID=A0A2S7KM23_9FLAO|nr:aspartate kinase [Aureitalea marina]PQB03640.1 hypothetical protein BST85_01030 [Aureitalea marina]
MSTAQTFISRPSEARIDLDCIGRKRINLAVFGCGQVGGRLLEQLLEARLRICEENKLDIRVIAVANSTNLLLGEDSLSGNWHKDLTGSGESSGVSAVIRYAKENKLQNLIAVDNTASQELVDKYPDLIRAGFNLVSSNKLANVSSHAQYNGLRELLRQNNKHYFYETNVGAGLPLIDTLKLLSLSGEKVTRVRGVFSGSLSYIFNEFSQSVQPFSKVLAKARTGGLTEPDSRLDLSGADVGRKLAILARELGLSCELDQVQIQNLIPADLRKLSPLEFENRIEELNVGMHIRRKNLSPGQVLRYVADLKIGAEHKEGIMMQAGLQVVNKQSNLGGLAGSDTIFEIFTPNYQKHPLVIQGAGAGADVTARGVLGDILRIGQLIH